MLQQVVIPNIIQSNIAHTVYQRLSVTDGNADGYIARFRRGTALKQ
jgi:hypothetical protein